MARSATNPTLVPGVTVLGNVSVDRIDDAPPSPGGCPSFAATVLDAVGGYGRIVTQAATRDRHLFAAILDRFTTEAAIVESRTTSAFGLRYHGENRTMTVEAIGPVWGADEIDIARPGTTWVHLAPLLRQDFPETTLAALADRGHRVSYDGQGLVRAARLGPMKVDRDFPPSLLQHVSVLKVADDEADVLTDGSFDEAAARRLGVPEILVTHGSSGCDVYVDGSATRVPATWRVDGVHTTGAGDMFATGYVASRAAGSDPVEAARQASVIVAKQLQARLDGAAGSET